MRRVVLVVATWSVGTLLAMALVRLAVDQVSSEVVNRPPAPISNRDVAAALGADADAATTAVPAGPGGPGATPTSAAPTSGGSGTPTTTTTPGATRPPAGGPAPTTPATSTPATTAAPVPDATTSTIDSVGGQVAVRYEAGRVSLVWARPKAGFEAEVHSSGPETVEVRFDGDDHESRVRAFWSDGVPDREVREQDDGGNDEG